MRHRCVAFYIRLSDADEDVKSGIKDESNSITAQRELLQSFIKKTVEYKDAEVIEYFDDGFSGTGFSKRESFKKMLSDAGCGIFECILVKDFSRLGRDYIEVGNYLEFVFPTMGIRFISVNDNYDSEKNIGMTGGMDVAFRNLIYQLYSRDLSRKVKSARRNRNLNGEYTASYVPYGYLRDKYDKHKLVIDADIAPYIGEIFDRVIAGEGCNDIARDFNMRNVPTRVSVQKTKCNYKPVHDMGDNLWDRNCVYSIVKNEMYMGKLIQNKWETVGFGDSKRYVKRKPEDWSVVENGLPAIVSKEVFDKANEILGGRDLGYHAYGPYKRGLNLFTCAYCGRLMSSGAWHEYYLCRMRGMGGDMRCNDVRIKKSDAHDMVVSTAKEYCEMLLDEQQMQSSIRNKSGRKDTQTKLLDQKEMLERSVIELYKKYRAGDISKDAYMNERASSKKQIADIEARLKNMDESADSIDTVVCAIPKIPDEYDAGILSEIIEKVIVYDGKHIEVVFKCDDVHKEVCLD